MEKDKSRGLKHIKDKRKYKGNTIKNPKHVPQKYQPNLGSNWDRYENEEIEDNQDILASDADFSILANAPVAKGKHLQTKSDKLLASEIESTLLSELFTLNLEKLEESLLAIPFYERVNFDQKYFLDNQIEYMNREAEDHLKKYNENNNIKIKNSFSEETDEEQEILHSKIEKEMETNKKNESTKNEDLEQWLDDFLNE